MAKKLTQEKALEILSDGRVHGKRLTRKQKKFFGAVADGAEPYKAQNGIEGTMGGLTDKGFNFNPAWGGAWKNGGWLEKYADDAQNGDEITYTHNPSGSGEAYALKRTVTPYSSKKDIRRKTQAPTDPRQVNFLSNYAGATGEPTSEGFQYPTSVPFEGEKHWNIDRFIIDPQFGTGYPNLNNQASTRQQMRNNVLADMYKYYMLENPDERGKAWRQAKRFVRTEINPRTSGAYYEEAVRSNLPFAAGSITDAVNDSYIRNFGMAQSSAQSPDVSDDDYYTQDFKNRPITESRAKEVATDWLRNYKGLSKKQTRQYLQSLPTYEKSRAFESGGILQPPMSGVPQPAIPMAQKGTRQPIYTSDPRDPRLRKYQDSLSLYNMYLHNNRIFTKPNEISREGDFGNLAWQQDPYVRKFSSSEKKGSLNGNYDWVDKNFESQVKGAKRTLPLAKKANIAPIATSDMNYGEGWDGQGRYAIYFQYKKPVQPVVYKKPPRKLEKPGKVELPKNIEFKPVTYTGPTDIQKTSSEVQITSPEVQITSETPTQYSYTYPSGNQQKTIYFPSKSTWKAFVDQFDGLNTTEQAGSFSATPGAYTRERRPNPVFSNIKFAMGGSLPGSVGFTYARVAGAAPSEGPRAKKTMPSAQNGAEMKFYQEGLDFTPKTISKNGGWLDKYDDDVPQAQDGSKEIKVKDTKTGQVKTYDTGSPEYGKVYQEGIGAWKVFDKAKGEWVFTDASNPNAQWEPSVKTLEPAVVASKIKKNTLGEYANQFLKSNPYYDFYQRRYNEEREKFYSAPAWAQHSVGGWDRESRQQNIKDQIDKEYQQNYIDYISKQLQNRTPQGGQRRDKWLSKDNFTEKELGYLTGSTTLPAPNLWAQGLQGVYNLADMVTVGALPEINMPGVARAEVSQYNNPLLALAPLSIFAKMVQSGYKDNYSFGDALMGRPNDAGVGEDIATDPFTWATFGTKGLYTGLAKGLVNKIGNVAKIPFRRGIPASVIRSAGEEIPLIAQKTEQAAANYLNKDAEIIEKILPNAETVEGLERIKSLVHGDLGVVSSAKIKDAHARALDLLKNSGLTRDKIYPAYKLLMRDQLANEIPTFAKPITLTKTGEPYIYGSNVHPEAYERLLSENPLYTSFEKDIFNQVESFKGTPKYDLYSKPIREWAYNPAVKTPDEIATLLSYANTDEIDQLMNVALREGDKTTIQFLQRNIEKLNNAIQRNKFPVETSVRRGIIDHPVELLDPKTFKPTGIVKNKSELVVGDVFMDEGFSSTSLDLTSRIGNPSASEIITIPGGGKQSYAYLNSLSGTPFLGEFEALLPKGLIRRVEEVLEPIDELGNYLNNARFRTSILNPYKKGGVVKDNMGYWNPSNHGKVVEIDSPYITMQGVDQPLLGISDTGDVQYMEPGNDYEFDGTSVREYPVAQKGKAVQTSSRSTGPMKLSPSMPTAADSLNVYNNAMQLKAFYDKLRPYYETVKIRPIRSDEKKDLLSGKTQKETLAHRNITAANKQIILANKNPNITYLSDYVTGALDPAAPLAIYDKRISPQGMISYNPYGDVQDYLMNKFKGITTKQAFTVSNYIARGNLYQHEADEAQKLIRKYGLNENELKKIRENYISTVSKLPGYITTIPYYDPLSVKPYAMRTKKEKIEWEKKYGKPKPVPPVKKETPKSEPKKEQPSSPERKLEKPGKVDLPEKIQLRDLPQPAVSFLPGAVPVAQKLPVPQEEPERVKKTPIKDWIQQMQLKSEEKKMERKTKRGMKRQLKCWSGVCRDEDGNVVTAEEGMSVNRADEHPLEKLDNLFNFTNYNKPKAKSGGWLDKYK